jgi:hypothetical protein
MELKDVFNKDSINNRAKEDWDYKDIKSRTYCGHKYNHIFDNSKVKLTDWSETFDKLTKPQQNILIKGELIRTYDGLSNKDKTKIKYKFGLSTFSSKWYKLPPCDKKVLLEYVI